MRNTNQGEYTKNTHCEKKYTSNNQGLECDNLLLGDIDLTLIFRQWDDLLLGII